MQTRSFRNSARSRTDAAGVAAHVCWIAPAPRSCASRKLGVLKSAIGTGKVQHAAFPDQFSEVRERRAPSICQRASNNCPCRHPKALSRFSKHSQSTLLQDQLQYLILEGRGFEICDPPVERDCRPVGAVMHLPLQDRIGVVDEGVRKAFRRPAGCVAMDIRLVPADSEPLFGPRKAGIRRHDPHVRKIRRDVVQMHRF